ncbi:MBL fold metallo-hydrolase [Pigmentibacter sp. JX0631]|uniref:MBL fold metallo-hydrolase n=1 Tax=Pigmentibacter sp. JX0631 TaxID=2976982 RepID=UPI0024693089|nr:MBL fold metallo-hydrolase [Pigmentibacter sp. JX0631]WGL60136.1 MBL fold metallo-hydrolase [Pigmentibacter sp. JX0631]
MSFIFKQFKDEVSSTYTYLTGDSNEIAIIDSVFENVEEYIKFIEENKLTLKFIIETHVHADHVTGINLLQKKYPAAIAVISNQANIQYKAKKMQDNEELMVGKISLKAIHTPGHTNDSMSLLVADNRLCTGDCLFIGSCGRTDFQQGSNQDMFLSLTKISKLSLDTLIYPGHDYNNRYVSNLREELLQNKVLKLLPDYPKFCAELDSWKLPPPKKIKESVPANLNGGLL